MTLPAESVVTAHGCQRPLGHAAAEQHPPATPRFVPPSTRKVFTQQQLQQQLRQQQQQQQQQSHHQHQNQLR